MKNGFSLLFLVGLFSFCQKEESNKHTVTYPQSISSIKNLQYYTYFEYRPKFTFLSSQKVNPSDPGIVAQNMNNPFPVDKVVNLGRVLFYDKNLSVNGQVSCGSCHIQSKAFTDGLAFSQGYNKTSTEKSAMSIQNMGFINNYMWQSNTDNLVELVKKPLTHAIEMGNRSIDDVIQRIQSLGYYDDIHKYAFGNAEIQEKSITWALAQFVGSIYSARSKFDESFMNSVAGFTPEEKQGQDLFFGKALCNECHAFPTFAAPDFTGGKYGKSSTDLKNTNGTNIKGMTNNGLPGLIGDLSKIKIPTLRNIEVTGPYMHDGRFSNLEEVIDFYDHGITVSENVDEVFRTKDRSSLKLNLSIEEKKALKAFLITLTDHEMLTAKRYSNPF